MQSTLENLLGRPGGKRQEERVTELCSSPVTSDITDIDTMQESQATTRLNARSFFQDFKPARVRQDTPPSTDTFTDSIPLVDLENESFEEPGTKLTDILVGSRKQRTKLAKTEKIKTSRGFYGKEPFFFVTFSIPPIHKRVSMQELLTALRSKPKTRTMYVTLKVQPDKLRQSLDPPEVMTLLSDEDDLTTVDWSSKMHTDTPSSNTFFESVRLRAERENKKSPKGVKRSFELPILRRDEFLVKEPFEGGARSIGFIPRTAGIVPQGAFSVEEFGKLNEKDDHQVAEVYSWTMKLTTPEDAADYICKRVPRAQNDARFSRMIDLISDETFADMKRQNSMLWTDLFSPKSYKHIATAQQTSKSIDEWICSAFEKLRITSTAKRAAHMKNSGKIDEMDSFIAHSEEEEEVFVPLLILTGPGGSGKSSCIYTIVHHQLGAHVFELNTGQSRCKKDIDFHLRQIGTTQIVQNSDGDANGFQNGVILLDDVDVLLEEESKDFWSSVKKLVAYSHRPIVMTCSSLDTIPARIVDQSFVYEMPRPKPKLIHDYLYSVALVMGYAVDDSILQRFSHSRDVRSAINNLQFFLKKFPHPQLGETCEIKETSVEPADVVENVDLVRELQKFDTFDYLTETYYKPQVELSDHNTLEVKEVSLEFYSSRSFKYGSRKSYRRYHDAYDFIDENPYTVFTNLSGGAFVTDVAPFIKSFASLERHFAERGHECVNFFEDPYQVLTTII